VEICPAFRDDNLSETFSAEVEFCNIDPWLAVFFLCAANQGDQIGRISPIGRLFALGNFLNYRMAQMFVLLRVTRLGEFGRIWANLGEFSPIGRYLARAIA
jgi:hypothetical protein